MSGDILFVTGDTPLSELKVVTQDEWQAMVAADSVLQVLERINAEAVKDPLWETDYCRAHYHAFVNEAGRYVQEKYVK